MFGSRIIYDSDFGFYLIGTSYPVEEYNEQQTERFPE
jgi:hypothetical protein